MSAVCSIDGFQFPPTLLTSHNPPYYAALIEGWGFEKAMDLYAWWFADPAEAANRLRRLAVAHEEAPARSRFARGNLRDIEGEGRRIREIYNQAWENNWGFVPFTESGDSNYMTKELKPIVVPEFTLLAEVEGEPVGFILCVPDINVALQKINGRLTGSDCRSG